MADSPARPRRFPRLPVIILGFILILISFFAWNLRTPANDPDAEAVRRQGYPITLSELDDWYRKLPDAENAALIYTNAFAKISAASNAFDVIKGLNLPPRSQPFAPEDKQELTAIFATNREILHLFDSAVALTNARYPIDLREGFSLALPHLTQLRDAMRILGAEGMVRAANGELSESARSFINAGRLTDSLSREPLLISQLVDCSNWRIIASGLEWTMNTVAFTPEQLERLQSTCAAADNGLFYRGLVGERASGYDFFTNPKSQTKLLFPNPSGSAPKGTLKAQLVISALKTLGSSKRIRPFICAR